MHLQVEFSNAYKYYFSCTREYKFITTQLVSLSEILKSALHGRRQSQAGPKSQPSQFCDSVLPDQAVVIARPITAGSQPVEKATPVLWVLVALKRFRGQKTP